jgi:hypothetical protein
MATKAEFFAKNKYVVHEKAISAEIARLGAQYAIFDALQDYKDEGTFANNAQVPNSHSKYADPFMESLELLLLPKVEESTGLSLYPTYSYYRLYKPGDDLLPHTDRPACEISLTINLGYSYNTNIKDYSWDIWVEGKSFRTEPGDMVIYRGLEMNHWREPFAAGRGSWQVQAFLHYVDVNGPYAMCKFDGRPSLGMPAEYKQPQLDALAFNIFSSNNPRQVLNDSVLYVTKE